MCVTRLASSSNAHRERAARLGEAGKQELGSFLTPTARMSDFRLLIESARSQCMMLHHHSLSRSSIIAGSSSMPEG